MKKHIAFLVLAILSSSLSFATSPFNVTRSIDWEAPVIHIDQQKKAISILSFKGAVYQNEHPTLPYFSERFRLDAPGSIQVRLNDAQYEELENQELSEEQVLSQDILFHSSVDLDRRQAYASVWFIPLRKNPSTGMIERLVSFDITISHQPKNTGAGLLKNGPISSVLSSGDIYKISISESGLYKIDANFLSSELGVNLSGIDPRKIKIYGNGGGMLPELNSFSRFDDLEENAIHITGENDGSFDQGDYILFYAEGPSPWTYNSDLQFYVKPIHIYDTNNHYFIKIDNGGTNGKRIQSQQNLPNPDYTTQSFDGLAHHEVDDINLLDKFINSFGTGKRWFGETFKFTTERDFEFSMPNLITSENVKVRAFVAGRSLVGTNHLFNLRYNNNVFGSQSMGAITGDIEKRYANLRTVTGSFQSSGSDFAIQIQYIKPTSSAEGWLDYITVNARSTLNYTGSPIVFSDQESIGNAVSKFSIAGGISGMEVWDITQPTNVIEQEYTLSGSNLEFGASTNNLKTFIAFTGSDFPAPTVVGQIANQNLHDMDVPEMVIVYHPTFSEPAQRLASHRSNQDGLSVETIELGQIYNEFSSGNADITAIRDLAKYLYDQNPNQNGFKYLLLFGDASFDYRNINENESNFNMVPTFETAISDHPISGYPSDDFFGLLDQNEGNIISGALDIAIGRIPSRTLTEANQIVDKIIRYETSPNNLGDWKNRLLFNADDEDGNLHFGDEDLIAQNTSIANPVFNLIKNYLDAYPQVTTPGGNRYPDASEAIDNAIFKGVAVVNYMGHGGSNGWAQERVLTNEMIESWDNKYKLPLFVTATCTFGPFDDPILTSAGELLVLKPESGAIGLFTTVRAVYASSNRELTTEVFENIFKEVNGEVPPIGEILRISKNNPGSGTTDNSRKFTLLGDPSMKMTLPKYNVVTTMINGEPVTGTDTIQALQDVTIEGYIEASGGGILTGFNGEIQPTVYDKKQIQYTLANDPSSNVEPFEIQRSIIFKGRATVQNGQFSFSFTMPSDINFNYGNGKISYYAHDGVSEDANGYFDGVIIGGSDPNGPVDDEDPLVEIFMNTEEFAFGGLTDPDPILLVKLSDDKGINTVGNGIGHDITAILDENNTDTHILNDFFEAELDNSRKGIVRFPLSDLAEGRHSISVKAWDIANNSGEDYTEFVVAASAELALDRVLNFPNPFTTHTNFQFEHNLPFQSLRVQVQIYTVSGNLVKTIEQDVFSEGYRIDDIEWDGTDDFGDRIGKGVYVYKINVGSIEDNQITKAASEFEKLVILK